MGKDLPRERKGIELPNNSIVGTTINVKIKQQSRCRAIYHSYSRNITLAHEQLSVELMNGSINIKIADDKAARQPEVS